MKTSLLGIGAGVALSLVATPAAAYEDLGPVAQARTEHPNVFVPREVNVLDVGGVRSYVYSGVAERYLDDETDSELWQEATLDAKKTLLTKLSEGGEDVTVEMSGSRPIYQVKEGKDFLVVLVVPEKNVKITRKAVAVAAPPVVQETLVATPLPEDSVLKRTQPSELKGMSYVGLRDYVADNPDAWRARWLLGIRTIEGGNAKRGAKHLDAAVRAALRDKSILPEELSALTYETAQKCDAAALNVQALKYYRMVLHLRSSPSVRAKANGRISLLLLHE